MLPILSKRKNTTLYLDKEHENGAVIFKVLNEEYPSPKQLARFLNEHNITKELSISGIRKSIKQTRYQNRYALLLKFIEGKELKSIQVDSKKAVFDALIVIIQLIEILEELHKEHIIHRDIKPENIILKQKDKKSQLGQAILIDFGLATTLDLKNSSLSSPQQINGTLSYISPEQTGRINRTVDHRSDYYSLGATIYTVLSGSPPYSGNNPMELIHAHLTQTLTPLCEKNPLVPKSVSLIVSKLLEKNPENRYQSAIGIKKDFQQCIDLLKSEDETTVFTLGEYDHNGHFTLTERLYGREEEINILIETFHQKPEGRDDLICIAGSSGVGKSALVAELYLPISAKEGRFTQGKFDQLHRNVPFSAFAQASADLIRQLMSEEEEQLIYWKERVQQSVGKLGRALLPIVPNLEWLLGKLPEVPNLEGAAGQHRLFYLARSFFRAVSPEEHPLVLFLDDLQWSDLASLDLLESLLTDPEKGNLFIIGAYRNNEVYAGHPLLIALRELEDKELHIQTLELQNLSLRDILSMLTDATKMSVEQISPLAKIVYQKTMGNAFFVRSFLAQLNEQKKLTYDSQKRQWQWDEKELQNLPSSDNVADLLTEKIKTMEPSSQRLLWLASCMGNRFALRPLAKLSKRSPQEVMKALKPIIATGLLTPLGQGYALFDAATELHTEVTAEFLFAHDKIQESANALFETSSRKEIDWSLGQMLLKESQKEKTEQERLFDILYHLNLAPEEAKTPKERLQLAKLNLRGAKRALQAGAYNQSVRCCKIGRQALPKTKWQEEYELTLGLSLTLAEASGLMMNYEEVQTYANEILEHSRSNLDKAKAYDVLAMVDMAREDLSGAIELGVKALSELGVTFPRNPKLPHIIWGLLRTQRVLKGRIEALENLPTLQNSTIKAALSLIERLMPAAFRSGSQLFPLFVFELVRLSAIHGNSRHAVFGLASFAIAQCAVLKDYDKGYRFAQLALRLGKIYPDAGHLFVANVFVRHWREDLRTITEDMPRGYRKSLEVGNLYQATWTAGYRLLFMFLQGTPLNNLQKECDAYTEILKWDEGAQSIRLMLTQFATNLRFPCDNPEQLSGKYYDESYVRRRFEEQHDLTEIGEFHIFSMLLALLFEKPEGALKHTEEVEQYIDGLNPMPFLPLMHLYSALVRLALAPQKPHLFRKVKKNLKALKKLSQEGTNYNYFELFAQAEWARAKGKKKAASLLYAESLRKANAHGTAIFHRGLLLQRSASFHEEQGNQEIAQALGRHSLQSYREWGASNLVSHFTSKSHYLLIPVHVENSSSEFSESHHLSESHHSTSNASSSNLDLHSLWKASSALSAEIVKDRLLEQLMQIMVENAGAERGVLLLLHQGNLVLEAIFEHQTAKVVDKIPLFGEGNRFVCSAIVQYVTRTKEALVLSDAQKERRFSRRPYIQENRVKSVLCAPIIHQGRQSAVIYMENNKVTGAFTPWRLEVITLLSAQAGTAIENAMLYQNLEAKVAERTQELKDAMTQLVQSEKMASLGTLVAGVAHELNNPTNFTYGGAQNLERRLKELYHMLVGDDADEESIAMLKKLFEPLFSNIASIQNGSKRIQEIVKGLRTFSRLDESSYKRVSLAENLESTVTLVHANYSESIEFICDFQEDPELYCRPAQLNQVFMNIMLNACQSISYKAEKEQTESFQGKINISMTKKENKIVIRFQDNGEGIKEENLPRIFEPFFTTRAVGSGAGLGLSSAFGIIKEHKGHIGASSEHGEGTIITITLPLEKKIIKT